MLPRDGKLLAIVAAPGGESRAAELGRALGIPIAAPGGAGDSAPVELHVATDRLELWAQGPERASGSRRAAGARARHGVALERAELERRLRQGRRLALARAVGPRAGLHVLDAMAGFGTDGFTLAALGCRVLMVESNVVMSALLADAHHRLGGWVAAKGEVDLCQSDVRAVLGSDRVWDVVYLDPMFADDGKRALPKQRMQLLRMIADDPPSDADLSSLVVEARQRARERVVVKRRRRDPALGGGTPDWSIQGRSLRFDVYRGVAREPSDQRRRPS
jgi:16S rRNA (guanine1516-N2)-methyltransferase